MPEPVLEIEGLRKTYKGHLSLTSREVIKGLDLRIERSEVFGLLGQNGAGKTTTIKTMLSLIFPDAGTIRIFGQAHTRVALRRRIGFLPENPFFYEYLTGREFLDFYGQLFGYPKTERRARSEEVMARWQQLSTTGLAGLNAKRTAAGLSPIRIQ